jgi:hypothetical protein
LQQQVIQLLDPAGAPISGVGRGGILNGGAHDGTYSALGDKVVVWGLDINQREMLLLLHKERRLGAAVVVEHAKTTAIRLAPCATISGRVVDSNGRPQSLRSLHLDIPRSEMPPVREGEFLFPHLQTGMAEYAAISDGDGGFQFNFALPGVRYEIDVGGFGMMAEIVADVALVKPGETIDVGTVTVKGPETRHRPSIPRERGKVSVPSPSVNGGKEGGSARFRSGV